MSTATNTDFSLRAIVRETLNDSTLTDPRQLATIILERLEDHQLRDALAQILPEYVRIVIGVDRSHAPGYPLAVDGTTNTAAPNRSWKVEALQDYGRLLRQRIHIPNTGWKFLADCGPEDLFGAAAERRDIATQTLVVADRYERLGKAVEHAGVPAVRNLPQDVIQRVWDGAEQ